MKVKCYQTSEINVGFVGITVEEDQSTGYSLFVGLGFMIGNLVMNMLAKNFFYLHLVFVIFCLNCYNFSRVKHA